MVEIRANTSGLKDHLLVSADGASPTRADGPRIATARRAALA